MTASATVIPERPLRLQTGPPTRRRQVLAIVKSLDVVSMVAAFLVATLLTGLATDRVSLDIFVSTRLKVSNFVLFLALVTSWRAAFVAFGLYRNRRSPLAGRRLIDCVKAITFSTLVLSAVAILFQIELITPFFLAMFFGVALLLVMGHRFLLRSVLHLLGRTGSLNRAILIAGTGPRALRVAQHLEQDPNAGARIVGFVDEDWTGSAIFRESGQRIVSDIKNLGSFLRHHVVDEMVIALPATPLNRHREQLMETCRSHGITVRFPASLLIEPGLERVGRPWDEIVMTVYNGTVEGWGLVIKRLMDVTLASSALVIVSPLMLVVALLVKVTSPGPVFFTQERMGLNKRRFQMRKFRTMYTGSEERITEFEHLNEMRGPTFKLTRDPRVTPIGRLLRRASIDELPQLFHVLRGEMSLVGPRPLALRDVNRFEDDRHRRRFSVRPGLTGLWQVAGRSLVPFEDWMDLDLRYVDEWSLALDLKILLKTVPVVLSGRGAL